MSGIYVIRHTPTGRGYVGGSGCSIYNRITWHMCALRRGFHPSAEFLTLWQNTQEDDWEFLVLEECERDLVRERERHWANEIDSSLCGHPATGYTHTPESRQRQRIGRARFLETPGAREDLSRRAVLQHQERRFGY